MVAERSHLTTEYTASVSEVGIIYWLERDSEANMLRKICKRHPLSYALDSEIRKLTGCPDCGGRGWFCDNPFAEHGKVYYQCPTCQDAFIHYGKHGTLPEDIQQAMSL